MRRESALPLPHRNSLFESMRQFSFLFFYSDIYIDYGLSPRVKLPAWLNSCLFGQFSCTNGRFSWFRKCLLLVSNGSFVTAHREYFPGFRLLPDAWKLVPDWFGRFDFYLSSYISLRMDIRCSLRIHTVLPYVRIDFPSHFFCIEDGMLYPMYSWSFWQKAVKCS